MHPYELQIIEFMKTVAKQSVHVEDLLLKPATKDIEHYLRKTYEDDPNRPFTLRLSAIGKPLCQQQLEKAKAPSVDNDYNMPLRMMYGAIIEGLLVSILRHSGIIIDEEQTPVALPVLTGNKHYTMISGTLDLVIEGKVWDIKSASPQAFKDKFSSYESLKSDDTFGYLPQLYGYSAARRLPPGGWIVIDKSSGEIRVLPVPDDYDAEISRCLKIIQDNVIILLSDAKFKRQFEAQDEKFNKKFTGNKILKSPCIYCSKRYSCWEGLQYLPVEHSTAYDKPYRHYVKLGTRDLLDENQQLQSKRKTTTEARSSKNSSFIPELIGA